MRSSQEVAAIILAVDRACGNVLDKFKKLE